MNFLLEMDELEQHLALPLIVAQKWHFPLAHTVHDNENWYAIQDWISGLTSSDTRKFGEMWRQMTQVQMRISITPLSYVARDGKTYKRDFTNDRGLYLIAQNLRITKSRPLLARIKEYLAKSGAFVDLVRQEPSTVITSGAIDPDEALEAVIEEYRRQGKDDNWINARLTGIVSCHKFTAALKIALVELITRNHYTQATDEVYIGLWQRTAAILKQQLGLTGRMNLRDHQPTLALIYQGLAEEVSANKLGDRQELTWEEAR